MHRWIPILGSEWVKPQTGHPSHGVLHKLVVELLRQMIERLRSLDSTLEECMGAGLPPVVADRGLPYLLPGFS